MLILDYVMLNQGLKSPAGIVFNWDRSLQAQEILKEQYFELCSKHPSILMIGLNLFCDSFIGFKKKHL